MCFKTYLNHAINKKNVAKKRKEKKNLGRSQFSKKRGGLTFKTVLKYTPRLLVRQQGTMGSRLGNVEQTMQPISGGCLNKGSKKLANMQEAETNLIIQNVNANFISNCMQGCPFFYFHFCLVCFPAQVTVTLCTV